MRKNLKIVLLACLLVSLPAFADTTLTLNNGNSGLSCCTPGYATVGVHLNSATEAVITFTGLPSATDTFLFGGAGAFGLNVAGDFSFGSASFTTVFSAPSIQGTPGPGQEDGFGNFNFTLSLFDGFTHSTDTGTITLDAINGNSWATDADVLTPNAGGHSAAAHIFACTTPCTTTAGAISTGFAADGSTPPVPEPATLAMMGAGMMTLAGFARRHMKR